jgi:hypothetical protein
MKLSAAKEKYLFTTKIELDDGDYLVLREPTVEETQLFSASGGDEKGGGGKDNIKALEKLFPKCLIDHTFTDDDGEKASGEEVYSLLRGSASLFADITDAWIKSIPFQSRVRKPPK